MKRGHSSRQTEKSGQWRNGHGKYGFYI